MIILSSGIGNYVFSNGRRYSYFAGNNYLGLACHPAVIEATTRAIKTYGVNFSASRHTTGTADIHLELERHLSAFKGQEDSVVFASGYQGNSILLSLLKDKFSAVFCDRFAHPSIIAGIPRETTNIVQYNHCDAADLENLLEFHSGHAPLVITDGIFALTGEIAPLDKIYAAVKKYRGILVVDDAHSTGVLGKTGKGTPEYFNLSRECNIYQAETMSKALGSYGGFISGSKDFIDQIRDSSAIYQASTALPPPVAAAAIASLKVIHDNPDLKEQLLEKAGNLRKEVICMGFQTNDHKTPIIPIVFPSSDKAKSLSSYLEENGIIVPFMNYPVKQEMHQVRIAVSVSHTADQTAELLEKLKKWKDKNEKDQD